MLTTNIINKLDSREKQYTITDSPNLFLLIKPNGYKYWRMRYSFHGVERLLSLGKYPVVDIHSARKKRDEVITLIVDDIDPVRHREKKRAEKKGMFTFDKLAYDYFDHRDLSDYTKSKQVRLYEIHLQNSLSSRRIDSLETYELIQICKKVKGTSRKLDALALSKRILRYAKVTGLIKHSPLEDVKGVLKPHKTKHHPCIIDGVDNKAKRMRVVGHLLNDIHNYSGSMIIAMGLFFMAFTFQRPSEVRTMKWSDIDFEEKLWRFRSSKMSVDHVVPLSETVLMLLNKMKSLEFKSDYILTNAKDQSRYPQLCSFSDALKGMGYKNRMVSHGFRALARTVLEEDLEFFPSIIEMQLSHMVRDPLGRAYNRTTYIKERFTMMNKWAAYLNRCYKLVTKDNIC